MAWGSGSRGGDSNTDLPLAPPSSHLRGVRSMGPEVVYLLGTYPSAHDHEACHEVKGYNDPDSNPLDAGLPGNETMAFLVYPEMRTLGNVQEVVHLYRTDQQAQDICHEKGMEEYRISDLGRHTMVDSLAFSAGHRNLVSFFFRTLPDDGNSYRNPHISGLADHKHLG